MERFFQFSLLGLVASGFLAVAGAGYLDLATVALTTAGLAVRALSIAGWPHIDLSDRAVAWIAALYAVFFLADWLVLSRGLLPAAVHLAFFLMVMKAVTAKTGRDHLFLAAVAVLELAAAALLSIDLKFFLALLLYLLFAIAALTSSEIRRSLRRSAAVRPHDGPRRFHLRLALLAGFIAAGILGLTAVMFFILPRTADAALSGLVRKKWFPGFSVQVNLGMTGDIGRDSRPMMHIRIFSHPVPANLRWRGAALETFDGHRWFNVESAAERVPVNMGQADLGRNPLLQGQRLDYHVVFDAGNAETLFFVGMPETVDVAAPYLLRKEGGAYSLAEPIPHGFHYDAYSLIEDAGGPSPGAERPLSAAERQRDLQLPAELDPRIPALARQMAGPEQAGPVRARAIEAGLQRAYGYSLESPKRVPADPLADFLFRSKRGDCEYFASAMTVMLRTLGIPARVATGFLGGKYNRITDLWVLRASDAHSWVEAWLPGAGWTTFDPTPSFPGGPRFALWTTLGLYLDAAQTFWQNWVIGYDVGRQGALADRVERGARGMGVRWDDAVAALTSAYRAGRAAATRGVVIVVVGVLIAGIWMWLGGPPLARALRMRRRVEKLRRGQATIGDATLLYRRMLMALQRQGFSKPAWFTPGEFAESLPRGEMAEAVAEFTSAYNELRFGGRAGSATRLSDLLSLLERGVGSASR